MRPKPKARSRTPKVTGGLKGFTEARKVSNDLLKDINTHVVAQAVKNAGVGREPHLIHVSELIKDTACPRMMYYKVTKEPVTDPGQTPFHKLEIIWATGHDAHHKWQRWIQEMGDLWGTWSCSLCDHRWMDTSPRVCPNCLLTQGIKYEEVELSDDYYHLVGHADGAVPRLNSLVEVKSFSVGTVRMENPDLVRQHTHKINGKQVLDIEGVWAGIKRPLKSHVKQGTFYLWFCKQMGLPYDRITFIYENKATQATKSFEIKLSQRFIQEYLDTLDVVRVAADSRTVPPRPALFAPDAKPCNSCVYRTVCWEEDNDDKDPESTTIPARRSRSRSQAPGREAAVPSATETGGTITRDPRRHHRSTGHGPAADDDAADPVGRAPGRATGNGRGGRAVGRRSDGEGEGAGFAWNRQGRDREEGQGLPE